MAVKSPCIDICVFDPLTGWCTGCGRNRDEATCWRKLSTYRRKAVERDLERRLARLKTSAQIAQQRSNKGWTFYVDTMYSHTPSQNSA
ncbi:DUF1289 domain-containing protein [Serratia sp. N21D137]|uniref:DUF1289 domain-containing protein n=1 Tax=Serratia sp. N21D137 TaxID=3397495 RepID=UPI0039DF6B46